MFPVARNEGAQRKSEIMRRISAVQRNFWEPVGQKIASICVGLGLPVVDFSVSGVQVSVR